MEGKPRRVSWLLTWGLFLAFAIFAVFLVARSVEPRAPGMPMTGGFTTPDRPDAEPAGEADRPMPSMPGMDHP